MGVPVPSHKRGERVSSICSTAENYVAPIIIIAECLRNAFQHQ